jgi:hypothetical protein
MKLNSNPIMIVFAVALVLIGALSYFGYRLFPTNTYMTIGVAVLGAIFLLLVLTGKSKENVGMFLVALWLILMGVMSGFHLDFAYSGLLLALLPFAAGFFIFVGI